MDFGMLNPWLRRKDIKKTDETDIDVLMERAREENPNCSLNVIALYMINVSNYWQRKGYNDALMAVTIRDKENRVDQMRREERRKARKS